MITLSEEEFKVLARIVTEHTNLRGYGDDILESFHDVSAYSIVSEKNLDKLAKLVLENSTY